MPLTVRARLKPADHLPEWFICCEAVWREVVKQKDKILLVLPEMTFLAEVQCAGCGSVRDNVQMVRTTNPRMAVAFEAYDLDEGVAA